MSADLGQSREAGIYNYFKQMLKYFNIAVLEKYIRKLFV